MASKQPKEPKAPEASDKNDKTPEGDPEKGFFPKNHKKPKSDEE